MIGNIASLQGDAEKLSVQQLQQSMRDGILPAYIGMPILQQKVQEQKQAQAAAQTQQAAPQPIAKQIEGEAQGLTRPPMQMAQAPQGVSSLPSNLPEEYARGGIIAFAGDDGSYVDPLLNDPYRQLVENRSDAGRVDTGGLGSLVNTIQQKGLIEGAYPAYMAKVQERKNALSDIANKVGDVGNQVGDVAGNMTTAVLHGKEGLDKRAEEKQKILNANAVAAEKHGVPVEAMNGLSATESSKNSKASLAQMAAIDAASKQYGVPSNILYNVADIESDFNPNAANPKSSALGGFQFTNDTWKTYGTDNPEDRKDFNKSAMAAAKYLKSNYNQFGDWGLAASGYNKGPNAPMATLQGNTQYINDALNGQGTQPQPQQQQGIQTPFAIPEAPQQNYSMPDFSALKRPETPAAEYQKQMQEALGENAGLPAIKEKLAKMEEEGASAKEKAPWMALMQAGLATMAGTSPFAGVNIGQGGVAGLKAYSEAQDKFDKDEEKRLAIQNQLANAQRAEQVAAWKYGVDSNKTDVAENKAIGLAEAKAKIDAQQNKNKDALDLYKAQLGVPAEQAKTALYTAQTQAAQHPSAGNLSDYEGAKKVAMENPTAPQYAKYFKTDPSGKPIWDELSFRSDYSKKEVIDKTPIADLYKIVSESQDPHMVDLATKKLNNVLGDNKAPQVGVKEGWKVTRD